ncbi:class I SAM-dependent methyltransferase, partial [bacterium]|nr:class I SAM-dependent methyltransferase [bacterium]
QTVLDAPCGAGRVAIHLARAGCRVTGVDLRPSFIDRAKTRFRHEKQSGRFFPLHLRDMDFTQEFQGIYSWHGSFGYFSDTENLDLLMRYALALRKGGRLLIDQVNREAVLRHFVATRQSGNLTIHNRWSPRTQRVESDWIVNRGGKPEHNKLSIRLYTRRQMEDVFETAGLRVESLFGSAAGEPYQRSSRRLIVVGRRNECSQ